MVVDIFLLLQQVVQQKSATKFYVCHGEKVVTHKSFLSKVAFESSLRKKLSSLKEEKNAKVFMTHMQDFF